ncbi:patatin-like phospholipase family protein [Mucilaginibacter paludis]|uniref:Patatin n=1 Tax=Mucilaginibacter paludis DSM 18603 TaxID=714943 RepID=H1XZ57_9SPHI|nr:patatin-like phospholipase family protein [Mucilaginibacter paludis]EHQ24642.1 Patatin [Mucilaginibacter paludis DSM 18603]
MNVLCLDGGGSKGIYTLGILKEFEALVKKPLHEYFQLIYGTSTGSIIAAMIGLGYTIDQITDMYYVLIPDIMKKSSAQGKSDALASELDTFFGNKTFTDFKTGVSIVATNYTNAKPLIFKRDAEQAYKLKSTFKPGFGVTIAGAVLASCAACPIFKKVEVVTENQGTIIAIDGGFIANNPTLLAITDATQSLGLPPDEIAILSLGTGNFIETDINLKSKFYRYNSFVQLFEKILKANTNTTEILTNLLFKHIPIIRINDTYNEPEFGTNMVEYKLDKLEKLQQLGRQSFGKHEDAVKAIFKIS